MTRLQYIGQSHYRTISAKDLKDLGFPDAGKIELQRENLDPALSRGLESVAEVDEKLAELLVKREKGQWKILADDQDPVEDPNPDEVKLDPSGTTLVAGAGDGDAGGDVNLSPEGAPGPEGDAGSAKTRTSRSARP